MKVKKFMKMVCSYTLVTLVYADGTKNTNPAFVWKLVVDKNIKVKKILAGEIENGTNTIFIIVDEDSVV